MEIVKKIICDYRQYGLTALAAHVWRRLLRFGYRCHEANIYAMRPAAVDGDGQICEITPELVESFENISGAQRKQFHAFLESGCRGLAMVDDGRLAGSAWLQEYGVYQFGGVGRMRVPDGCAVVKNLFVAPEFRGRGIAGRLDRARLGLAAASSKCCLAFIVPENRYAIANWQKLGMTQIGRVKLSWRIGGEWKIEFLTGTPDDEICSAIRRNLFVEP